MEDGKPVVDPQDEGALNVVDSVDKLPEWAQKEIKSLRNESAKYRTRSKEYDDTKKKADDYEALLKKQQEEQGKYKELYEKEKERVKDFDSHKKRIEELENWYNEQIENEKKDLPETFKEIVENSKDVPEKKLDLIKKIKAQLKGSSNSPESSRPGSGTYIDEKEWEKIYADKLKMLEIHDTNKSLYDQIIKKFKGGK